MVRVDSTKKVPRIETPTQLCRVAASIAKTKNNTGGTSQNTILVTRMAEFPWESAIVLESFSGGAHTRFKPLDASEQSTGGVRACQTAVESVR
jgi:hypothetical protein